MKNILGLDVGDSRVGVAIGHEETKMCFSQKAINRNEAKVKIKNLIQEKEISLLVVGLPLSEQNEETSTSQKIRTFANKLSVDNNIPVVFIDEYYSSQEAKERLNIKTKDKKTRDLGIIDSMSAVIILERYFTKEGIIV